MVQSARALTTTDVVAATTQALEAAGYRRLEPSRLGSWPVADPRVFEDSYGVVAVAVFETWHDLHEGWADAQESLVRLMSENLGKSEAKAWDGYLVLMTPSLVSEEAKLEAETIRYDTSRVRKYLATGDDIREVEDIRAALLPLLPLGGEEAAPPERGPLDALPALLARYGIDPGAVEALVEAFREQRPLVQALDSFRSSR